MNRSCEFTWLELWLLYSSKIVLYFSLLVVVVLVLVTIMPLINYIIFHLKVFLFLLLSSYFNIQFFFWWLSGLIFNHFRFFLPLFYYPVFSGGDRDSNSRPLVLDRTCTSALDRSAITSSPIFGFISFQAICISSIIILTKKNCKVLKTKNCFLYS